MPSRKKPALSELLAEELKDKPRPKRAPVAALAVGDDEPESAPRPTSRGVTPPDPARSLAPARDFNKRANSIDKLALPAGIFPGSSQKLYNALYVRTRGAVVPVTTIRATKRELSDWSGIRNAKTIDSHLRYFSAVGLVVSTWERGQNEGALYEIFLPEETSGLFVRSRGVTPPDPTSRHVTPPNTTSGQISGSPHPQKSGSPHPTNATVESTTSENRKTSFKTNTEKDDDEAFAALFAAERELTGKHSPPERWHEVAELLVAELKIAAGRTTVSSVPAFLAEHLRRRLWKKEKRQIETEAAAAEVKTLPEVDASQCPDCFGTSMYYPEGFDKGVARCEHKRLTEAKGEVS
jgi:hypothetical protein